MQDEGYFSYLAPSIRTVVAANCCSDLVAEERVGGTFDAAQVKVSPDVPFSRVVSAAEPQ
jgi:hypothetical protein